MPQLVAALDVDTRRFVRLTLVAALESIGSKEALPALARALGDRDVHVRSAAALAHWRISGEVEPGLRLLVDTADARALRRAGEVPPAIVRELEAAGAIEGLGALGPQARPALDTVRHAMDEGRIDGALAFFRITGEVREPLAVLLGVFRKGSQFQRREILACLQEMAPEHDAVALAVAELLADENPAFREAGAAILGRLGAHAEAAAPALETAAAEDPAPAVRKAAADALAQVRKPVK